MYYLTRGIPLSQYLILKHFLILVIFDISYPGLIYLELDKTLSIHIILPNISCHCENEIKSSVGK